MRKTEMLWAAIAVGLVGVLYFRRRAAARVADKPAGAAAPAQLDLARVGSPDRAARSNQGWRETYYPPDREGELASAREFAPYRQDLQWGAL